MKKSTHLFYEKVWDYLTALAILAGFALTIFSLVGNCESCGDVHKYRLFRLSFETVGILYFIALGASFLLSTKYATFGFITGLLLAVGLGSEIMFIQVQKYGIGNWCYVCLGIAATIAIASITYSIQAFKKMNFLIQEGKRRDLKKGIVSFFQLLASLVLGAVLAFIGISKVETKNIQIDNKLVMGNQNSPIELFVFTSWVCPACQKFEPSLERMVPRVWDRVALLFIDQGEEPKTLNYLPYHLSFMQYNKAQYVPLRNRLKVLANETDSPTDKMVQEAIRPFNVRYQPPSYAELIFTIEFFKDLIAKYKITALPSIVVENASTKKKITLSGSDITMEEVEHAIEKVAH